MQIAHVLESVRHHTDRYHDLCVNAIYVYDAWFVNVIYVHEALFVNAVYEDLLVVREYFEIIAKFHSSRAIALNVFLTASMCAYAAYWRIMTCIYPKPNRS